MQHRTRRQPKPARQPARPGFTLVELLVSVTLVLMIMVMFTQVYQMATETVSTQKGIRRNDQRARMLSTVIRGDLDNRTFQQVIPFSPGQTTTPAPAGYNPGLRRGYFTISENDPNNEADDVLAFTVQIPDDGSQTPYLGRATLLGASIAASLNQPDFDDGNPNTNSTGASRAAEVVYFLRNGNLYRRQLLIRDVYNDPVNTPSNPQPQLLTGIYAGEFWKDFSYSAYYRAAAAPNNGPKFHGISNALANSNPDTANMDSDYNLPRSLGIPYFRYGYSPNRLASTMPLVRNPLPREYIGSGATRQFIGRFLMRETSDANFLYPGRITSGDPHVRTDLTDSNGDQIVDQYAASTSRRGEDLLMTNVHAFDVKVWDHTLGQFVDLGHSGGGIYNAASRHPSRVGNDWNRYDTWHPFPSVHLGQPPFKPGSTVLGSNGEVALRAIQITIRFYDVATDRMRQVTIQHSLVP
ncbi:MAG: hypothetical protein Tsb009_16920 [Planctomycetaceae bacterium]